MHIRITLLILISAAASAELVGKAYELTTHPTTVRIRQEGPLPASCEPTLHAARGEYESLQISLTGLIRLSDLDAAITPFANASGEQLPADSATLYRVEYVPVRFSAPRATEALGMTPDPLVPFIDPYTGKKCASPLWTGEEKLEGAAFGATPFEIWPGQRQTLWLDVHVPRDAKPGEYDAILEVRKKERIIQTFRITLIVWDFTLPEGPTLENHFGGIESIANYHGLRTDDEKYSVLEERYAQMFAENRLNPPTPRRLFPAPADDGTVTFDTSTKEKIAAYMNRYHVTNFEIPHSPFGDAAESRDKSFAFYRSWYAFLLENKWADRSYVYMFDEPNTPEQYDRVRRLGAFIHEAEPRIRKLVVEQPYTHDSAWGSLDDAIDIWCPLFGFIEEKSNEHVKASGDDVWSYTALVQTAHPYHPEYEKVKDDLPPFWQIDFPLTSYRVAPWLNWRYGVTGLLYWSSVYWDSPKRNPWHDPGFRVRWNGEGSLFYPGEDAGIEGPIASIRLKALRDGMEDYEYFALLASLGKREEADAIAREAVPTWGTWKQDALALPHLRERLAAAILRAQQH